MSIESLRVGKVVIITEESSLSVAGQFGIIIGERSDVRLPVVMLRSGHTLTVQPYDIVAFEDVEADALKALVSEFCKLLISVGFTLDSVKASYCVSSKDCFSLRFDKRGSITLNFTDGDEKNQFVYSVGSNSAVNEIVTLVKSVCDWSWQ